MKAILKLIGLVLLAIGLFVAYDAYQTLYAPQTNNLSEDAYIYKGTGISFGFEVPDEWFVHQENNVLMVTPNALSPFPLTPEALATTVYFLIVSNALTPELEEHLHERDMSSFGETFFGISEKELSEGYQLVEVSGNEFLRTVTPAGGSLSGEVLHYVYLPKRGDRIISLSQYPYAPNGVETAIFEDLIGTFTFLQ